MPNVEARGGRVYCGTEDWGADVPHGSKLSCCGCVLKTLARVADDELCDCRCHDTARFLRRIK